MHSRRDQMKEGRAAEALPFHLSRSLHIERAIVRPRKRRAYLCLVRPMKPCASLRVLRIARCVVTFSPELVAMASCPRPVSPLGGCYAAQLVPVIRSARLATAWRRPLRQCFAPLVHLRYLSADPRSE